MAITNRELAAGTKLVATFKKQDYVCEVVDGGEDGKVLYRFDVVDYKSPSAAGSAVMGGTACNGWRFWTVDGEQPVKAEKAEKAPKEPKAKAEAKAKLFKNIKRTPNQNGTPDGQVKWYCSTCQNSFLADTGTTPTACPEGHGVMVEDELAPVA